jgi:hypothetical protein
MSSMCHVVWYERLACMSTALASLHHVCICSSSKSYCYTLVFRHDCNFIKSFDNAHRLIADFLHEDYPRPGKNSGASVQVIQDYFLPLKTSYGPRCHVAQRTSLALFVAARLQFEENNSRKCIRTHCDAQALVDAHI